MTYHQKEAHVFVPNGSKAVEALARTTHLAIVAHPDDLEFIGWHPILECFNNSALWYTGVIASDGRASPRAGEYAQVSDQEMVEIRLKEQRHAAITGEYSAVVHLMHSEYGTVMGGKARPLIEDIKKTITACKPKHINTHNLADAHPHHLLVAIATISALRELKYWPQSFYGGEIWRSLDWMIAEDKLTFDVSKHENLTASLMGVYDSQISGGKRYDLATAGRKRANATYYKFASTDHTSFLEYAMDLMPLLKEPQIEPAAYLSKLIDRFKNEVLERLNAFAKES